LKKLKNEVERKQMKMTREDKIRHLMLAIASSYIAAGVPYEDGRVAIRCLGFLMDEVNANPGIDEDFLAEAASRLVHEELNR
jgi:hypothetical protein